MAGVFQYFQSNRSNARNVIKTWKQKSAYHNLIYGRVFSWLHCNCTEGNIVFLSKLFSVDWF